MIPYETRRPAFAEQVTVVSTQHRWQFRNCYCFLSIDSVRVSFGHTSLSAARTNHRLLLTARNSADNSPSCRPMKKVGHKAFSSARLAGERLM